MGQTLSKIIYHELQYIMEIAKKIMIWQYLCLYDEIKNMTYNFYFNEICSIRRFDIISEFHMSYNMIFQMTTFNIIFNMSNEKNLISKYLPIRSIFEILFESTSFYSRSKLPPYSIMLNVKSKGQKDQLQNNIK